MSLSPSDWCKGEMFDRRMEKKANRTPMLRGDSSDRTLLFYCWHPDWHKPHPISTTIHCPPPPPQHGGMRQGSLEAPLMNMYDHYEWLTCCFAYAQPLSSEYRSQGPIGAQWCLSKLPSLWSRVYQCRSWSAPQVDRHNELWVLIIFFRGGKKCFKRQVGFCQCR